MGRIGACECRADGVGVLHREIDDAGNDSLRIFRRRRDGQCGLAQPARQHFMTAAVGVQRRLQWKALLGTPAVMFMNKIETSNSAATQQPHYFVDMFSAMTGQLGQEIGISGLGEFRYFGQYRLLKLRRDGRGITGNPVKGRGQDRTARDATEGFVERVEVVVGHGCHCRESTIRWHSDRMKCPMALLQTGDNLQSVSLRVRVPNFATGGFTQCQSIYSCITAAPVPNPRTPKRRPWRRGGNGSAQWAG